MISLKSTTRLALLALGAVLGSARAAEAPGGAAHSAKAGRMNVLFIMSDQHNARALGSSGNQEVKTPNLDALAAAGAVFTHAICQTGQCVPSRFSIWTGRYARSTGTYANGQGQNPAERTVADLFDPAGYYCATIGKHHQDMTPENHNHGFALVKVIPVTRVYGKALPYDWAHPGRDLVGEAKVPNEQHNAGMTAQTTIDFLKEHGSKPFVVWCSFYGPHTPICVSKPWSEMYDPKRVTLPPTWNQKDDELPGMESFIRKSGQYGSEQLYRETLAYYYGYVSQIDYNIGRVLQALDDLRLSDHTIVVYTADHGEMMAEHSMWTKAETGYEATIRVPLIIRAPGLLAPGTRVSNLACSIDLLPTLLSAAGLTIPANVQGKSLIPLANGRSVGWRKYAFSELGANVNTQAVTVTSETAKYVRYKKAGNVEYEQLFDLAKDPWETKNLARVAAYAPVREELKAALAHWEASSSTAQPVLDSAGSKTALD
jgi:arylsulfatase